MSRDNGPDGILGHYFWHFKGPGMYADARL